MGNFKKVFVLGSTGMLGARVSAEFTSSAIPVVELNRQSGFVVSGFDSTRSRLLEMNFDQSDLIVNCVGWIPQKSRGNSEFDTESAISANSVLPTLLEQVASTTGAAVLQILTDCVYQGDKGNYSESDHQDASDLYGLSKRLGEHALSQTMGVRCSIVGFSSPRGSSLFDWFLTQSQGARVPGFVNHFWNGVTTKAFASLAFGVFTSGVFLPGKHHWIPSDSCTKFELLKALQQYSGRVDINLQPIELSAAVDRRLTTNDPSKSRELWSLAGYSEVPSILELVRDLIAEDSQNRPKGINGSQD